MLIVPSSELERLIDLHRLQNETDEACVLRLVKLALHLQEGIDRMAKISEDLWQSPR